MTGMVTMIAAAAMSPIGWVNGDTPGNCAMAAGTVWAALVAVSEIANTKSFQQIRKTMMNVFASPGAASGAITFVNA